MEPSEKICCQETFFFRVFNRIIFVFVVVCCHRFSFFVCGTEVFLSVQEKRETFHETFQCVEQSEETFSFQQDSKAFWQCNRLSARKKDAGHCAFSLVCCSLLIGNKFEEDAGGRLGPPSQCISI